MFRLKRLYKEGMATNYNTTSTVSENTETNSVEENVEEYNELVNVNYVPVTETIISDTQVTPTKSTVTVDVVEGVDTTTSDTSDVTTTESTTSDSDTTIKESCKCSICSKKVLSNYIENSANETDTSSDVVEYTSDTYYPTLKYGSTGESVVLLQRMLNSLSKKYSVIKEIAVDGIFGIDTLNDVIMYQGLFNINTDGVVGKVTWESLESAVLGEIDPTSAD